MDKRRVVIIVLGVLLIMGSLYQIKGISIQSYELLFQPLPAAVIQFRFYLSIAMLVLGIITGIGLLFLREVFRKIAVFIGSYIIYNYLIEGPLLIYRNLYRYISLGMPSGGYSLTPFEYFKIWAPIVSQLAIELCFGIFIIYFFTRPAIKEQFSKPH